MSKSDAWRAIRKIVAERDSYRCYYCKVPTAATIEHLDPRSKFGLNNLENLRLACPSCNSRRGNMEMDVWMDKKGWLMELPEIQATTTTEMVIEKFHALTKQGMITTGTPNSKLQVKMGVVYVHVRAGREDNWQIFRLGDETNTRVVRASYDFLRRHHTPKEAKKMPYKHWKKK